MFAQVADNVCSWALPLFVFFAWVRSTCGLIARLAGPASRTLWQWAAALLRRAFQHRLMQISLSTVISSSTVVTCLLSANTTICVLFGTSLPGAVPRPKRVTGIQRTWRTIWVVVHHGPIQSDAMRLLLLSFMR